MRRRHVGRADPPRRPPPRPARPRAAVTFAPIRQLRAHEYVAEQIRRHIALRLICPGESLPSERKLATIFGVGRETIQHALRQLGEDGLLFARRGRRGGTFVSAPAEDIAAMDELMTRLARRRAELEELLVYRQTLEPAVAGTAARTRGTPDLKRSGARWRACRTRPTSRISCATTPTSTSRWRERPATGSCSRQSRTSACA
ncbi:MAG: FadR family transcriptional regulator [Solirubrobacterales bacterium]|nr:FadR family transcriptional regulator [Solirubrobacterales bacterium]